MRFWFCVGFFLLNLLPVMGQDLHHTGLPFQLKKNMEVLDYNNHAWLIRQSVIEKGDTSNVFIQVIDLRFNSIQQYYHPSNNQGSNQGLYLRNGSSPFFHRFSYKQAIDSLTKHHAWNIMDASFFEAYQDSTQLSFPLSVNGDVITGGSSHYGPSDSAVNSYYKKVKLNALVIYPNSCLITSYNPKTGFPLHEKSTKHVIVTYNYKDHPANQFAPNQKNRFLLVGTMENRRSNYLFFVVITNTTISRAAKVMRGLGVKSTILALDGGASVFLYNRTLGTLLQPQSKQSTEGLAIDCLPHYLYVKPKKKP